MPPWDNRPELRAAISAIRRIPDLNRFVEAMESRGTEMVAGSVTDSSRDPAPTLAGIAANPRARALLEVAMDRAINADSDFLRERLESGPHYVKELVVGSGVHAAIYASTMVLAGGEPPFVVERRGRPGGAFALAQRPVFLLNSRNRPESLNERRRPGTPGPLNSEVGGLLQPSDIGSREYQTQDDQAFVTRIDLILNARILTNARILKIERNPDDYSGRYCVSLSDGTVTTDRIVVASGVGEPIIGFNVRGNCPGLKTFDDFVAEVGSPTNLFPLRGYRNVAVVGANDSGKVTVEYLLGQAGDQGLSVAALDTVERITWVGQDQVFKEDYERANRSRYAGIGRSMPRREDPGYYYRVFPEPGRAIFATPEGEGTRLRWRGDGPELSRVFDHVIICTGFEDQTDSLFEGLTLAEENVESAGKVVGRKLRGEEVYKVGPASKLALGDIERRDVAIFDRLPDNTVAVFRYAELTASAARLFATEPRFLREGIPLLVERPRPSTDRKGASFTFPSTPMTLPEAAVSEDVLRCVQQEIFKRNYVRLTLAFAVRSEGEGYLCEVSRIDKSFVRPGSMTCREAYRFITDPAVQAVLARQFRQHKKVTIYLIFEKTPRGLWIEGSG